MASRDDVAARAGLVPLQTADQLVVTSVPREDAAFVGHDTLDAADRDARSALGAGAQRDCRGGAPRGIILDS